VLFHDGFSCFCRTDHPALAERGRGRRGERASLSLESYAAQSHALVSARGEGPGFVDELLARQGLRRKVALRVPSFFSALAIVERSDLILTAPSALARMIGAGSRVLCMRPPLALPEHAVQMIWHERFSSDPGHAFLRQLLLEVGGALALAARPERAPAAVSAARSSRARRAARAR
jgi:DNA-binding transcriptional LysR family regulator